MDFPTLILIALALAMDALAVALGVGAVVKRMAFRPTFRLSFHFGLFQFMMPVLGWLGGVSVQRRIQAYDHWAAFGLLAFVGARMIYASMRSDSESYTKDPTKGMSLVMLSVATSIDALAVGLSLAVLHVGIWYPSAIIGLVACTLTIVGLAVGASLGRALGKRMELIGGLVLVGIGIRIVLTHLA